MCREAVRHGGVVPGHEVRDDEAGHQFPEQNALSGFKVDAPADVRLDDPKRRAFFNQLEVHAGFAVGTGRQFALAMPDWFLPVENTPVASSATKQMLRPLGNEIPAQVAETKKIWENILRAGIRNR